MNQTYLHNYVSLAPLRIDSYFYFDAFNHSNTRPYSLDVSTLIIQGQK